jgi:hypothetical protein
LDSEEVVWGFVDLSSETEFAAETISHVIVDLIKEAVAKSVFIGLLVIEEVIRIDAFGK